jgi:hypothetical protein
VVEVYYYTHEIEPIMETITDSAASTITCSDVADWQTTGVKADDIFKIGQNTVQVVADIGANTNIPIAILGTDTSGSSTDIIRPNGDGGTLEWSHTDSGGDGSHYKDLDEVVVDPNAGDGNIIYTSSDDKDDIFTMPDTIVLGADEYGLSITLHAYFKKSTLIAGVHAEISTPDAGLLGEKAIVGDDPLLIDSYQWGECTWENLQLDQDDLDDMLVILRSSIYASGTVYVDLFYLTITYGVYDPFTNYISQNFRGNHAIDALNAVCKIEGADWCEDYVNNRIILVKPTTYQSAGVSLTYADFGENWNFEDACNQVARVDVWGKKDYNIHEYVEDITIKNGLAKQITDERVLTAETARAMAQAEYDKYHDKAPSITLVLFETYPNIQLGRQVNLTFTNPDIDHGDYPVRMIQRKRFGIDGIMTIVTLGLGQSKWDENIVNAIKKAAYMANKAITDKLLD